MLIDRDYMLEKPSGPSTSKLFLDQTVVPALANTAGAVEGGVERVVVATRRNPLLAVGIVVGIGLALAMVRPRRAL